MGALYRSDGRQVETSVLFWWEIGGNEDRILRTSRRITHARDTSVYVVDRSRAARQLKKPAMVMRATPSMSL